MNNLNIKNFCSFANKKFQEFKVIKCNNKYILLNKEPQHNKYFKVAHNLINKLPIHFNKQLPRIVQFANNKIFIHNNKFLLHILQ